MLWGSKAQEKAKTVSTSKYEHIIFNPKINLYRHLVLKYAHPSPLAGTTFA
jgi:uracil DNA glycosylase